MSLSESILLKHGLRSDGIWTNRYVYKSIFRHIPLFLDTYALMRSQYWSREKIERLQDGQLKILFRHAVDIPYWRDVFLAARTDIPMSPREILSKLPVTKKGELAGKSLEYIANTSLLKKSDPDHTSGSTGKPFHFYQDWHASLRSYAVTERIFRTTGKRFPVVYMRARPRNGFTFFRHVWFYIRGYNSIRHRMDDFKELGRQFRNGFILYGYTSWVVEFARQMENLGIELPVRVAMVAGEHLAESDRVYIERVMKTEIFTLYASREVGFLGYECKHHKMHISEEWAYVEIVDGNNLPLPPGSEGRIIVTTFDNRVMPFIRYDIGDTGIISDSPCACGRTLRTLTFKGRTTELIELEGGRIVSLLDIAYALGSYRDSILQYQIVQTSEISFVMRVVPGSSFGANKEFLDALMVRLLHPRAQIRWELIEAIPDAKSGKAVYFIRDFENTL